MLHIDEETVRRHLPMPRAIALLESAFAAWAAGEAVNQPRRRMILPTGSVLHSLAGATGAYFGTKVYSTHLRHGAWFHFLLYDAATAQPLALFDANWLGQIRTGAASGVATRRFATSEAATMAILGSGFQARSQVEAVRCVREIRRVLVWSRTPENAARLAEEIGGEVAPTAEEAVAAADIIATATPAKNPLFDAAALRPRAHINAAGANAATRREIPGEAIAGASRLIADSVEQCRIEAGDLLLALDDSGWSRVEELRTAPPRRPEDGITVFKSVGLGLEDVAVAAWVYEQVLAESPR